MRRGGTHHVVVKGRLNAFTAPGSFAVAAVGRRTLIIEPAHMTMSQAVQSGT
jgi:hypothetical protein